MNDSTMTRRPLHGIRVLDLTRALAGPFCSMVLGDLGAEVIKLEPSQGGDMTRTWGPFAAGQSVYYLSANRSKRSLAIDFRHPRALPVIRRLVANCDVVIENFKPGVAEAMGLGYEALREVRPALVYASISGFGSTGPAREWPGFDQIAQGHAGLMALTGDASPTRVGVAIADMTAGMWTALGIVTALRQAQATGQGERLEVSLIGSLVSLLGVQGQRYLSTGEAAARTGNANPVIAPYGTYAAADGLINIAPATEAMWCALCEAVGLPQLPQRPDFATNALRVQNRKALDALLQARLAQRPKAYWIDTFVKLGIPAGMINSLPEVFDDPQVRHGAMVRTVVHPTVGEIPQLAIPLRFESVDVQAPVCAPALLGQDTLDVLRGNGFAPAEIEELLHQGVVRCVEGGTETDQPMSKRSTKETS